MVGSRTSETVADYHYHHYYHHHHHHHHYNYTVLQLTPVFSSLIFSPSTAICMLTLCLCSPLALMAILSSCRASWHIRSPRASFTSRTPINFPLKSCPSPRNFCSLPPLPGIKELRSLLVYQVYFINDGVYFSSASLTFKRLVLPSS